MKGEKDNDRRGLRGAGEEIGGGAVERALVGKRSLKGRSRAVISNLTSVNNILKARGDWAIH